MKNIFQLALLVIVCFSGTTFAQFKGKILVKGLENPESVAVSRQGGIFVSSLGKIGQDGDGAILEIKKGKAEVFAANLDDPKGITFYQDTLYVNDKNRVWKINKKGQAKIAVPTKDFPHPPIALNDVVADPETGTLYVADSGDQGKSGAVYRISPKGKVTTVIHDDKMPELNRPNGLAMDGQSFILLTDSGTGILYRIRVKDGKAERVAGGFGHADGLAWDLHGQLFITDWKGGRVFGIHRPGDKAKLLPVRFNSAADLCFDQEKKRLLIPDMRAGTLTALPASIPGAVVDTRPLPYKTMFAFPKIKWTGWEPLDEQGKVVSLRPLVLTHAGDGSNRVFVAMQRGVIHVFPNDSEVKKTKVFLDIQEKVLYKDRENEQGLLGLAFHPDYEKNGEFFVFYTLRTPKLTNILSRFRVSKDDPNKAVLESEEELLRIKRPFWNHDGGTITFGPDGYLYIALGDGGKANDPFNNAQNLKTLLGTVLRIDVNRTEGDKKYGIPKDNPFVGRKDALPEIWCYGLRNVWRMAFDRKTGKLWAGEVGQNLFEEINILTKGGNYGWKLREALHPFGFNGVTQPTEKLIEPIWEYHHQLGLSITGGHVYRGKEFPDMQGMYIYGDYVKTQIWALKYDEEQKRVTENRRIQDRKKPILSFGEDENGEVYLLTMSLSGQGIYRFARTISTAPKR